MDTSSLKSETPNLPLTGVVQNGVHIDAQRRDKKSTINSLLGLENYDEQEFAAVYKKLENETFKPTKTKELVSPKKCN